MTPDKQPLEGESGRYDWAGAILTGLAGLLALFIYLPITQQFMQSDDFLTLRKLLDAPSASAFLSSKVTDHFQPVLMSTYLAEHTLFGLHVSAYHWFNLVLHVANVALVGLLVSSISGNWRTGGASALCFAGADNYWHAVTWWSTRGFLMATFFVLSAALFILRFSRTGSKRAYAAALACYVLMLLSFSYGLEVTVMFSGIYLAVEGRWLHWRNYPRALGIFAPFYLLGIGFFTLSRFMVGEDVVSDPVTLHEVLTHFMTALGLGMMNGFGSALSGAHTWMPWLAGAGIDPLGPQRFAAAAILIIIFLLLDWRSKRLRALFPVIALFVSWGMAAYALPVLPRMEHGATWFSHVERYRYYPTAFLVPALVMLLSCTYPFTRVGGRWAVLRGPVIVSVLVVMMANVSQARDRVNYALGETMRLESMANAWLDGVREKVRMLPPGEQLRVVNLPPEIDFASWNARAIYLCRIFLTSEERKRMQGVPKHLLEDTSQQPFYYPEYGTGRPVLYPRPAPVEQFREALASRNVELHDYRFILPAQRIRNLRLVFQYHEPAWAYLESATLRMPGADPMEMRFAQGRLGNRKTRTAEVVDDGLLITGDAGFFYELPDFSRLPLNERQEATLDIRCAAPPGFAFYLCYDFGIGFTRENRMWLRTEPFLKAEAPR